MLGRFHIEAIAAMALTLAIACERRTERPAAESGAGTAPAVAAAEPASPVTAAGEGGPSPAPAGIERPGEALAAEPSITSVPADEASAAREAAEPGAVEERPDPARAPRPPSPTAVSPRSTSETEVALRWSVPAGTQRIGGFEVLRGGAVVATTTAAEALDQGLSPATRYCYSVRAVDDRGRRSGESARTCVTTPDLTAPRAPAGLSAQATSDREVALRWEAASDRVGVATYEVLAGEAVVLETAALAAKLAGLSPGREYCYVVVARDAAGNRSPPTPRACATTRDVTPPTEPGTLTAHATSETTIELRWTEASDDAGVEGYRVLRGDTVVAAGGVTAAGDVGLKAGKEYCYTVVAYDAAGNVSRPAGPACATTLDRTPPTPPGRPVAKATSEDRVEIRWAASDDNVGVASYEVRRADGPRVRADGLAAAEEGLRAFTEYCFTVVALDAAANRSAPAGPACARTLDVTPPSVPTKVVLRPASQATVEVRWAPSRDNGAIAGYELLRDGRVVESVAEPSAMESQLAPSTEYCYRVRAYDAAGNRSPESGPVCATTLAPLQPPAPRYVVIERTPSAIQVAWGPAERPDLVYRVYEEGRPIGATRFLRYAVRRLPDGKRRCYTVGAVDDAGRESPKSEEACAVFLRGTSSAR